jgi:hypothetical protein
LLFFDDYKIKKTADGVEVVLYLNSHGPLVEFAEEFNTVTNDTEKDINRIAMNFVKKNFPGIKVKTIKVMMGGALISTIVFSGHTTQAFANENGEQIETNVGVEAEAAGDGAPALATEEGEVTQEVTTEASEASEEVDMEEPGLIPGDFFYFAKVLTEKIQLALTFNDVEKAKLLSEFANERIAEANALFEAGETERALETLNESLENQELALEYTEDVSPLEVNTSDETGIPPTEDDADNESEEATERREELETQFSKNMAALLMAMEKVKNPTAKAALAKNVEKAYARMEKKLGKMQEVEDKLANGMVVGDDLGELHDDITKDEEVFEKDFEAVVKKEGKTKAEIVTPRKNEPKQTINQETPTQAQKGQDIAQEKRNEIKSNKEEGNRGNAENAKQNNGKKEAEVNVEMGADVGDAKNGNKGKGKNRE